MVVPRDAPYLPLNYTWRSTDGKTRHVSKDVIDKCPELANGWDAPDQRFMERRWCLQLKGNEERELGDA